MTGGAGADQFRFDRIDDSVDTIADFELGLDQIDLRQILNGTNFSSATPFEDYIQLFQFGADTQVQVDRNGDRAGDIFRTVVILTDISATDVNASSFLL